MGLWPQYKFTRTKVSPTVSVGVFRDGLEAKLAATTTKRHPAVLFDGTVAVTVEAPLVAAFCTLCT